MYLALYATDNRRIFHDLRQYNRIDTKSAMYCPKTGQSRPRACKKIVTQKLRIGFVTKGFVIWTDLRVGRFPSWEHRKCSEGLSDVKVQHQTAAYCNSHRFRSRKLRSYAFRKFRNRKVQKSGGSVVHSIAASESGLPNSLDFRHDV